MIATRAGFTLAFRRMFLFSDSEVISINIVVAMFAIVKSKIHSAAARLHFGAKRRVHF